ncbi:MAG: calcium-binding protein [Paracoccaceae bacterium]
MLIEYLDDGSFDFGTGFFDEEGIFEADGTASTPTNLDLFNPSTGVSVSLIGINFPNTPDPTIEEIESATLTEILFSSQGQDQMRVSDISWNLLDFLVGLFEIEFEGSFSTLTALFDQSDVITIDGTGASSGVDMSASFQPFEELLSTPFDIIGLSSQGNNLFGATGHDNVSGGEENDTIVGGDGNDTLLGKNGEDSLVGGEGQDELFGADGNDTILGDDGDDLLGGASGSDNLFGGDGRDTLFGGDENDTLDGGDGDDNVSGGNGDDVIVASQGRDQVNGNAGNDTINYSGAGSAVTVKLHKDTAVSATYEDSIQDIENVIGTDFDDKLVGDIGDNELWSGAGNDTINNLGGNDTIHTGTGEDFVLGSSDGEQVILGNGDDVARTRGGNDLIEAGEGNDTLAGNGGEDTAFGDDGDDTFFMGSQNDTAFGGAGADTINGGFNADVLDGGADDDRVRGEAGMDQLNGGDGNDLLVGGANADTFWFFDTDATGVDRITDFQDGLDTINLSDWGFASDADVFALASMAGGANQHTRIDFTDGSGGEVRALVIENLDISDFDASDFLLTGSDPFVF